jgi:ankyrin repeat protein
MLISCSIRQTALHKAAYNGRVEVLQLLLSYNAAVDARAREYRPCHCIVDVHMDG